MYYVQSVRFCQFFKKITDYMFNVVHVCVYKCTCTSRRVQQSIIFCVCKTHLSPSFTVSATEMHQRQCCTSMQLHYLDLVVQSNILPQHALFQERPTIYLYKPKLMQRVVLDSNEMLQTVYPNHTISPTL